MTAKLVIDSSSKNGEHVAKIEFTGVPKKVKVVGQSWVSLNLDLLLRFQKAFNSGKMHSGIAIKNGGNVYYEGRYIEPFKYASIEWTMFPKMKYLNSELKKIGF